MKRIRSNESFAPRPFAAGALLLMLALAGCSGTGSGASSGSASSTRVASGNSMLAQVRAAGRVGNELDVRPLRDPQVEDLRTAATAAEARGDYPAAERVLAQALQLMPSDPDLLQWQAEMALVGHDWARASQLATQSWDRGPKLGGLCRRNWTTLQLAAEGRGDVAGASAARQRAATCAVTPPIRY